MQTSTRGVSWKLDWQVGACWLLRVWFTGGSSSRTWELTHLQILNPDWLNQHLHSNKTLRWIAHVKFEKC